MTEHDVQSHVGERLLSGQNKPTEKPQSVSSEDASEGNVPQGQPPRHFYRRTLILILVPALVTAYFFVIWLCFIERGWDSVVKYGYHNEVWLFYSWFVLGVFGLDWSKHGLVGVEAAMLQQPFWQVPNVAALLFHGEASWSGPGGWLKCVKRIGKPSLSHRLWYMLALLSFVVFVTLPISGLCLELSDGYVPLSSAPMVIGQRWDTFHRRNWVNYYINAYKAWEIGSPATIPGIGIIYTPKYVNRDDFSNLAQLPNTLPLAEGIPEMFFSPQAKAPVSGRPWGLLTGYNCSIVEDVSEFTILNQKSESRAADWVYPLDDGKQEIQPYVTLETPDNKAIYIFDSRSRRSRNIYGYIEMGSNIGEASYNGTEPLASDPSSFGDKAFILEYVIWQALSNFTYTDDPHNFTDVVDPSVKGLGHPIMKAENGSYVMNETFFHVRHDEAQVYNASSRSPFGWTQGALDNVLSLAPPVGIRCVAVSTLGYAKLDPRKSTFHNFEQTSSTISAEETTPKLGYIALQSLLGRYFQIFSSSNSPNPVTESNSVWFQSFIQPQVLQRSLMAAYAVDVLHIMYDGTYGFGGAWQNKNLTDSEPGKVVTSGVVPPIIPAILFGAWALGCLLLGLVYGFRRRWSDTLDGYSFFRFGVLLADKTKGKPDFARATEFEDSRTLWDLGGLVGDMKGRRQNGNVMMNKDGGYSSGYGG